VLTLECETTHHTTRTAAKWQNSAFADTFKQMVKQPMICSGPLNSFANGMTKALEVRYTSVMIRPPGNAILKQPMNADNDD
jgi:hypothetical protein